MYRIVEVRGLEHLKLKMCELKSILCDSVGYITASMLKCFWFFFVFVFTFQFCYVLGEEISLIEAEMRG